MDTSNTDATSSPTRPGIAVRDGLGSSSTSTSTSTSSSFINGPTYALNGKIMLCTVIVLFVALAAIIGLHSYARWLFLDRRRRLSRRLRRLPVHQAAVAAAAPLGGLDASVLKSIPTFTFHAAGENPGNPGDCAVCLSEFEDGETGRALPKCGHAFHVECIDMWFQTHSNCPLCRAPVQARPEENAADVDPAAIPSPSRDKENGNSSSDNSPVELVGISVEAPPSMEERLRSSPEDLGSGSDGANLAKSPGKPALSMKRICSVSH